MTGDRGENMWINMIRQREDGDELKELNLNGYDAFYGTLWDRILLCGRLSEIIRKGLLSDWNKTFCDQTLTTCADLNRSLLHKSYLVVVVFIRGAPVNGDRWIGVDWRKSNLLEMMMVPVFIRLINNTLRTAITFGAVIIGGGVIPWIYESLSGNLKWRTRSIEWK